MLSLSNKFFFARQFCAYLGEFGNGAGKSGGSGGSIRNAGGAFGRLEAAREGEYFFHLQEQQVKELKDHMETASHLDGKSKITERERLFKTAAEQRAKLLKDPPVE